MCFVYNRTKIHSLVGLALIHLIVYHSTHPTLLTKQFII
jgi:hypothetical protein